VDVVSHFSQAHMIKLPPSASLFASMVILSKVQFLLFFNNKRQHKRHGFVVVMVVTNCGSIEEE